MTVPHSAPAESRVRGRSLRIAIHAPRPLRSYVVRLAQRLTKAGHAVRVEPGGLGTTGALDWLLTFEALAYRTRASAFAVVQHPPAPGFGDTADLLIDLAGDAPAGPMPALRVAWDGVPGELGLVSALLDERDLALEIERTCPLEAPIAVARARLAVERPHTLGHTLDAASARLATLLLAAIDAPAPPAPLRHEPSLFRPPTRSPLAFGRDGLGNKLMARLADLVQRPNHWRIALRTAQGGGILETHDWSGEPWRVLPDDGRRYYADPFLFCWQGRRWLFCEEYPYATARGILSVAEIGADGVPGTPRPILDTGSHLSWPQVFARGDTVYMIPESTAAGRVELWRATDFPFRWALDCVLIEGVRAHDPQLHLADGAAFLLATLDDDGGSSWDALGLFHAPDLHGPWTACAQNPLLVDVTCARGAGPLTHRDDALWRAAQDCSDGYGSGLALCRVTRLDTGGFAQEVVTRLGPPPLTGARGVHTLSCEGGLEAIDLRYPLRTQRHRA